MQESVQGPCTGHFNRWYFESNKLMCVPFVYGGCRGNRNNFLTAEECNEACKIVRGKFNSIQLISQYYIKYIKIILLGVKNGKVIFKDQDSLQLTF